MLSDLQLYQTDISKKTKDIMPTWWSISILLFLVSFLILTRSLTLAYQDEIAIPASSGNVIHYDNNGLSQTELETLVQLSSVFRGSVSNGETNDDFKVLYDTFAAYLMGKENAISSVKANLAFEKIDNLNEIINQEYNSGYDDMSLEGKNLFYHITKEIFQLYGLDLKINVNGDIRSITDTEGRILYSQNTISEIPNVQVNAIIIILLTAFVLLFFCILLAKKNHLLKKEVIYDGIDKERYA